PPFPGGDPKVPPGAALPVLGGISAHPQPGGIPRRPFPGPVGGEAESPEKNLRIDPGRKRGIKASIRRTAAPVRPGGKVRDRRGTFPRPVTNGAKRGHPRESSGALSLSTRFSG